MSVISSARRRLLKAVALLAALPPLARARDYTGGVPWRPDAANPPRPHDPDARWLTPDERRFLGAAVDRLMPKDDWPSASELGTVDYVDGQLAGAFGRGDMYYLKPPYVQGLETQGYQSPAPRIVYRLAIAAIETEVARRFDGRRFDELDAEDQDASLTAIESGEMTSADVDLATFFELLLENTMEGCFGDPLYGGNADMQGWKMLGFPGARYDYRPWVDRTAEKLEFVPVSILGFRSPNAPEG